jgi:YD repeat-containing protein
MRASAAPLLLLSMFACNSGQGGSPPDTEGEPNEPAPPGLDNPPQFSPPDVGVGGGGEFPGFGGSGSFERPTDERPVVRSAIAPRAIQGGTLAISPDDALALVADPDRDRLVVVDLVNGGNLGPIALGEGTEPGRVVFDPTGRAFVALRGSGELATVDLAAREVTEVRAVCGVPNGIAYDAASDSLHVACTGGELVTLPAEGGAATRTLKVEQDLRDVVVQGDRLFVSTFKKAELLEIDTTGAVLNRKAPTTLTGFLSSPLSGTGRDRTLEPAVAWRLISAPNGRITMLHQRAQLDEISIAHDDAAAVDGSEDPMGGSAGGCACSDEGPCDCGGMVPFPGEGGDSGYGGGQATCTSIVETGVTNFDSDGTVQSSNPLIGAILPVDGAVSPDGQWIAVAAAGAFDDTAVLGTQGGASEGLGVIVMSLSEQPGTGECVAPGSVHPGSVLGTGQAVAVAYDKQGNLVVQTRDPNRIRVYRNTCSGFCASDLDVTLGGEARRDTGHDLFHLDAGAGLACASCHPGGGDDGRTWHFAELGPRRTQLFTMGIRGTEPFHWDGDLASLEDLMGEVFVRRMGGAPQSPLRLTAMDTWLNTLAPLPSLRATDDEAAVRGKHLFESSEVGCTSCHTGSKLTNNESHDVGTGGKFQVPSLINVVYHQPYIHDGCAKTLRDRFNPECGGGDAHGKTSHLNDGELDDLTAYLETL